MPSWYGKTDLEMVLAAAPKDLTRDEVLLDLFGTTAPADMPVDIGAVGAHTFRGYYHKVQGTSTIEGATVPFTVEAWVSCKHVENGEDTDFYWHPLINRTLALAKFYYSANSQGLRLHGCGLNFKVAGAWVELKKALLDHPRTNSVTKRITTPFGEKYEVSCSLVTPDGPNPCIVSVWIIEPPDPNPRLVTAYAAGP